MKPADRVVINTGIQYARVFITMGISLYSMRLLLHALGAEDYGIFNLVAGVISMFAFFNTAIATSTQRFLSFHHGKEDAELQKKIFNNSIWLHLLAGILVAIALEFAGLFLFTGFLNIPADRVVAAKVVYHSICIAIFFSIISMPFTSLLVARENILWVALLNTIEIILKLFAALLLMVIDKDRLLIYGLLMPVLSLCSFLLNAACCFKKYNARVFPSLNGYDRGLIKELTSFAGWNLFGSLCSTARYEGLAILLNLFFGAVINAAFGIANQVAAQLSFFSATMLRTINPQIMKSEGANDRKRMLRLSMTASKFGFYLLAFFAVPCVFEMPAILGIWLKNVPDNTVIFCSLVLVGTLVNQLTIGLEAALQATGKVKVYQLVVGLLLLCNIPLAYILLQNGFPAYTALVCYAVIELLACGTRLYLAKKIAGLSVREYFYRVLAREIIPLASIIITGFLVTHYMNFAYRFLLTGMASVTVFSISIYLAGLCGDEKIILHQIFDTFTKRLRWQKSRSFKK